MGAPVDPFAHFAITNEQSKKTRFETFILHNPFTPLMFRILNLALTAGTLAVAVRIRLQERRADIIGVIGTSTLFAIVVAPIAIVHIFITLYVSRLPVLEGRIPRLALTALW